ncbi:MAG: ribosome silencing factor [Rhodoplanes sp.]|nr:ribosome silencing factor [Rhodoplanes sp.]
MKEGPLTTSVRPRASAQRKPAVVSRSVSSAPAASASASKPRPDADETLRLVLTRLDDMKAEDTTTIDLRDKSTIADTMVIASGRSSRHVGSIADRVIEDLHKAGLRARVEGMPHCDWVLIDAGDVVVHVFRPEVRSFYALEKMWAGRDTGTRRAS